MNTKITFDLKSLLVGAAASAALVFSLGAGGVPANETGRYQIAVGGDGYAGIVDTTTGQAWSVVIQNIQATPNNLNATNNFYRMKSN